MAITCNKCGKGYQGKANMKIECKSCESTFHIRCAGISEGDLHKIEAVQGITGVLGWFCKICEKVHREIAVRLTNLEKQMTEVREALAKSQVGNNPATINNLEQRLVNLESASSDDSTGKRVQGEEGRREGLVAEATKSVFNKVCKSFDDMENKKFNIVVRDLAESNDEDPSVRREQDCENVSLKLGIDIEDIETSYRPGKKIPDAERPRILIVRLRTIKVKESILRKGVRQQGLRVGPDLTKEERDAEEGFFQKLNELKIKSEPGVVFRIRGRPGHRRIEKVQNLTSKH